jgi:DNA-nicking Smr family endonuclease
MIVATMTLVQAGEDRCLAGHDRDGETVYVLRRVDGDRYDLHRLPISEADQALRSFLAADQSEAGELVQAILESGSKQARRPRTLRRRAGT